MENKLVHYFVEGDCEKKLIDSYKVNPQNAFIPGKVSVFNFLRDTISRNRLMMLAPKTVIVLVYDIDVEDTHILELNLKILKKYGFTEIYHIQSIFNFEDELVYSSDLHHINDLFQTEDIDEFKSRFIRHKDIVNKLGNFGFNPNKIWSRENQKSPFAQYANKKSLEYIKNLK